MRLQWADLPDGLMGQQCGDEILISKRDRRTDTIWRLTLLHELCHLKLPDQIHHGKKFQNEMLRLAKAGAFNGLW